MNIYEHNYNDNMTKKYLKNNTDINTDNSNDIDIKCNNRSNNKFNFNDFSKDCDMALLSSTPPDIKVERWIRDENVNHCYNCKSEFSLYYRKHHCRSCGRIFCYNCCYKYITLPHDFEKFPTEPKYLSTYVQDALGISFLIKTSVERVCSTCYNRITNLNKIKNLIIIFKLVKLDINDLNNLLMVSKSWHSAAMHCIIRFKEIQFILPMQQLSKDQKEILWINRNYLCGHSKWLLQLIKSVNFCNDNKNKELVRIINTSQLCKCIKIFCTNKCNEGLIAEDALELLLYDIDNPNIQSYIVTSFRNINTIDELLCYLPYITYHLKKQHYLIDYLIDMCILHENFRREFYWNLLLEINKNHSVSFYQNVLDTLKEKIKEKLNLNELIKLNNSHEFVKIIEKLSKLSTTKMYEKCMSIFKNKKIHNNPLSNIYYQGIDIDKISIKDSYCQPILLPFYYFKNNKKIINSILFKKENLCKDQIVVKIIKLIDIILKTEEKLDLDIVQYNVIPINNNSGFIEIVNDSVTISDIIDKQKFTIQNYISEHNNFATINEMRTKFIGSTAAYCVISYILGLGDRHLENIMISKSGSLFHIDFSYLLGLDPKYANTSIRITPEIIDAMGGLQSENYVIFKNLCARIYGRLRKHIGLFMNLLLLLAEEQDEFTTKKIEKEIIKRFEPGIKNIDAKIHIQNIMEKNYNSFESKIVDFVHSGFKNNSNSLSASLSNLNPFSWTSS
jgi:hypothetical protein